MKKFVVFLLALSMALGAGQIACAEDTGIQIIGGPEAEAETVSLDDFKVGDMIDIAGYGEVQLTSAYWRGSIEKYYSNTCYYIYEWLDTRYYNSGSEAEYFILKFDILNTQKEAHNFYDDFADLVCTYNDEYQFGGWLRQIRIIRDDGHELPTLSDTEGGWDTPMLYRDYFAIVFTLPNDVYTRVTENGAPMTISFKLGENEFTYIYRK